MCCKSVCVQAFARHTHMSETPTNSSYFICILASKWPLLLVPLTALFLWVMSILHAQYPWAQSSLVLTLALRLLALALASKTSGLGLECLWPCPWPWPQRPVAFASSMLSWNTSLPSSLVIEYRHCCRQFLFNSELMSYTSHKDRV